MNAPGVANTATLHDALKSVGLKYSDVETTDFPTPMDHVAALKNKSVDASVSVEPAPTLAVQAGAAIIATTDDQVTPNHQIAVLMYSEAFANRPEIARKFMRAYIRAVRFYNGALKDGRLAGRNADEVIAILTEYTPVKNGDIYRMVTPTGMNPDGLVNVKTLADDLAFYTEQGWAKGNIKIEDLVDLSFARAVVRELGPYSN